jgi:heme/copper-type cytochrome/quinol oxidase subunit 2
MQKHPPDRKYPAGLEWTLFKKIPLLAVAGFLLLAILWATVTLWPWQGSETEIASQIQQFGFALIGAAVFYLTVIVTVAIGCVVVLIMKGPRYTADSYPVEDAERPGPDIKR